METYQNELVNSTSSRTAIFFDGGYVRLLLKEINPTGYTDYRALVRKLSAPGEFVHAFYYDCQFPHNTGFLNALSRMPGFTVRLGELLHNGDVASQKGVDTQMTLDIADIASSDTRVNTIVLVTGDSDFVPAVEYAQQRGIRVVLAHAASNLGSQLRTSQRLLNAVDASTVLDLNILTSYPLKGTERTLVLPNTQAMGAELPQAEARVSHGESREVGVGQTVEVLKGATAKVLAGGTVIARPGSRIHALKGAVVYLCADVEFTGTSGFKLIPVVA